MAARARFPEIDIIGLEPSRLAEDSLQLPVIARENKDAQRLLVMPAQGFRVLREAQQLETHGNIVPKDSGGDRFLLRHHRRNRRMPDPEEGGQPQPYEPRGSGLQPPCRMKRLRLSVFGPRPTRIHQTHADDEPQSAKQIPRPYITQEMHPHIDPGKSNGQEDDQDGEDNGQALGVIVDLL